MDPLPLTDLKAWLSDESYRWIEEDDINQAKFQKELEEEARILRKLLKGEVCEMRKGRKTTCLVAFRV